MKTLDIIKPIRGSLKHLGLAVAVASGLLAGTALAAPANDDFAAAIDLTGALVDQTGSVVTGTQTGTVNVDATLQAGEPTNHGMTKTVWFKWTCPVDGSLTVTTLGSTNLGATEWDAVLGIYTGAAVNALTPLGGSPQDGNYQESMTVAVTAGTTYSIQLGGYNDEAAANILLNWNFAATVYEANILTFGPGATVDEVILNAANVTWLVPYGTNLSTLAPTFTLSPGATCNQTSGAVPSPDFSGGPVVYTVTSQGASIINNYTVTVVVGNSLLWDVAGGGDWDISTSNWFKQPSGPVTTFADGDEVTFNNAAGGTINIPSVVLPLSTTIGAASGDYTFSGAQLGGIGSLTMGGSGTLTLASANSYSGATVVNGGTLVATGNGALGSSTNFTVATGATLQLNGTAGGYKWPAAPSTLTGAGTVNIPLGGNANIGNNFDMSAFTGTLNITSANGMMAVNSYYSPGFTAPPNGTINIGNNTTLYLGWQGTTYTTTVKLSGGTDNGEGLGVLRGDNATLNGAVILNTNSKIGTAGGSLTINAVISDGGNGFGFTQVGSGTVTLTATNTYTGTTTVNGGATLKCNTPDSLGSGSLSINGMLNLDFVGNKTVTSLNLAGGGSMPPGVYGSSSSPAPNQNNLRFAGTGTVTVPAVVVQKTVLWNVAGGGDWDFSTLNWYTQPSGPVSTFVNGDDAIFNNAAGGTINIPSTVSPLTTTVGAAAGNYTFSGASLGGTGSLTMGGSGSLTLASTNSYLGSTVVNGGTLVVSGNGAIGGSTSYSVATGAILQLNGTNAGGYLWPAAPSTLTGAGTVNIPLSGQANVGNNFNMTTFTGVLNLSGGMMGVNSYFSPGFTAPPNGTINIGNNTTLYLGWQGTVYNTTVKLSGGTDNGEGYGVLRGDNATLNGAVILATNSTIGSAGGSLIINSVISDGGSGLGFTAVGGGTVTLTGANTYTGPTTVNSGVTLKCDTSGSLGGGALSINGTVNLNYAGTKTVASLTLAGVPKGPGVYGSSASAAPPANQDDARFVGTGTVTIGSDYGTWASAYLPTDVSDPAADNDGDGLTNQQEYAFGLNPTLGSSVNPITVPLDKTTGMFTYTRRATPAATGLTYTVQTSADLAAWAPDGGAVQNVTGTVGDVQTVEVTVSGAPLTAPSIFVRIKAAP